MQIKYFLDTPRPHRRVNRAMPQHALSPFHRHVDRWVAGFFEDFPYSARQKANANEFSPQIDLTENAESIVVKADLPGMKESDISVSLKEAVLTIKGEKKHETDEKTDRTHHRERFFGSFNRSIRLSKNVDADNIKAKFDNGVLTVTLPKAQAQKVEGHTIEVQGN